MGCAFGVSTRNLHRVPQNLIRAAMALRTYSVYLEGGAAFNIKAARFEVGPEGVVFYLDNGQPLADTYIDPRSVIAVLPPTPTHEGSTTGFLRT